MIGFRWIVKEKLAGSAQPGLYADWEEDLDFLQRRDIGFIMSLTESPDIEENAKAAGLGFYHLPIRDMDVPKAEIAVIGIQKLHEAIESGQKALIHCKGGIGRTGMIGACYLVYQGLDGQEAIESVRRLHHTYIQTKRQEIFVETIHKYFP